jgi:hypothetical protein
MIGSKRGIRSSDKRLACPGCGSLRAAMVASPLVSIVQRDGAYLPIENGGIMDCLACRAKWAWDDNGAYLINIGQPAAPPSDAPPPGTVKPGRTPPPMPRQRPGR